MRSQHKRGDRGGKSARKNTEYTEEQRILSQPKQSYSVYEDNTDTNDDSKDFETLITTLPSAKGDFTFKCEKNWSSDASECFDYFTLDLKLINAALKCIPFNQGVRISDVYFTADQLTHFHNAAEEGKKSYKDILSNFDISKSFNKLVLTESLGHDSKESEKSSYLTSEILHITNDNNNLDQELDLLLSLESSSEQSDKKQVASTNMLQNDNLEIQIEPLPTKPVDLESWLDSILDD